MAKHRKRDPDDTVQLPLTKEAAKKLPKTKPYKPAPLLAPEPKPFDSKRKTD